MKRLALAESCAVGAIYLITALLTAAPAAASNGILPEAPAGYILYKIISPPVPGYSGIVLSTDDLIIQVVVEDAAGFHAYPRGSDGDETYRVNWEARSALVQCDGCSAFYVHFYVGFQGKMQVFLPITPP